MQAISYSWPAQVLIIQKISGRYQIPPRTGSFYQIEKSFMCGGTIINSYTILTAAHCINMNFEEDIGLNKYVIPVADPFEPTQYSVYVGAYDLANRDSLPTVKMAVKKVIRVIIIGFFFSKRWQINPLICFIHSIQVIMKKIF